MGFYFPNQDAVALVVKRLNTTLENPMPDSFYWADTVRSDIRTLVDLVGGAMPEPETPEQEVVPDGSG